jgi:hypothetical protein
MRQVRTAVAMVGWLQVTKAVCCVSTASGRRSEWVGGWVGGCAFVCDVQDQSARSRWVVKGRVAVGRGEGCWPRQSADPDVFWVTWSCRGELREIRPHFALSVLFWLRVLRKARAFDIESDKCSRVEAAAALRADHPSTLLTR